MKILAFAGSNSSQSINRKLVKYALTYFEGHEITFLDLNDYEMPLFSVDREAKDGHPYLAHEFLAKIAACDLMIVSLAEHNRSYTVAFKNIFDWCSRINVKLFQDKPMFLMSTSPGRAGGVNVMNTAKTFFPQFGANILETFSLPQFQVNFSETEGIAQPELQTEFLEKINKVAAFANA